MNFDDALIELAESDLNLMQIARMIKDKRHNKCVFCEKKFATHLCDGYLGHSKWVPDGERKVITLESIRHTCDAPICEDCKTKIAITFWPEECGGPDTTDLCPACVKAGRSDIGQHNFISQEDANQLRFRIWRHRINSE